MEESVVASDQSSMWLPLTTAIIEDAPKIQAKHLKENLGARGLPPSGAKGMSTQHLRKALNGIVVTINPAKITTLFPVPKPTNITRNNRTRGARQGEAMYVGSAWIPLELDESRTTVVERTFT